MATMNEDQTRFDVIFNGNDATLDYHFCREWIEGDGFCYGNNPNHGYTFDQARERIIEHYTQLIEFWKTQTFAEWANLTGCSEAN